MTTSRRCAAAIALLCLSAQALSACTAAEDLPPLSPSAAPADAAETTAVTTRAVAVADAAVTTGAVPHPSEAAADVFIGCPEDEHSLDRPEDGSGFFAVDVSSGEEAYMAPLSPDNWLEMEFAGNSAAGEAVLIHESYCNEGVTIWLGSYSGSIRKSTAIGHPHTFSLLTADNYRLSPDGSRLAAILGRSDADGAMHLHIIPVDSTEEPRHAALGIESGLESYRIVGWSPSGGTVLVHYDRPLGHDRLLAVHADTLKVRAVGGGTGGPDEDCGGMDDPCEDVKAAWWSEDSSAVLYVSSRDDYSLWRASTADGDSPERISGLGDLADSVLPQHWQPSPDGRRLVYSVLSIDIEDGHTPLLQTVRLIDLHDGADSVLSHNSPHIDSVAAWSPDGSRAILESNRADAYAEELFLADMSRGWTDAEPLSAGWAAYAYPAWSDDGRFVAFAQTGHADDCDAVVVDAASGTARHLTDEARDPFDEIPAGFSPDGTAVLIARYADRDTAAWLGC